jgi:hypothetical protein
MKRWRIWVFATVALLVHTARGAELASPDGIECPQFESIPNSKTLFDHALLELDAGKLDAACELFARAYCVDKETDKQTAAAKLFSAASCEVRRNRLASARVLFESYLASTETLDAAAKESEAVRRQEARTELAKLDPRVPRLSIVVPVGVPAGFAVRLDGRTLAPDRYGAELPIDPGEHVIVTEQPGYPRREHRFSMSAGQKRSLSVEWMRAPPAEKRVQPKESIRRVTPAPRPLPPKEEGWTQKNTALVVGAVGVSGAIVAGVMTVLVLNEKGTISDRCDGFVCEPDGKQAADSAQQYALIGTISGSVAIVGLGASAALWLTAPTSTESPSVRTGLTLSPGVAAVWAHARF